MSRLFDMNVMVIMATLMITLMIDAPAIGKTIEVEAKQNLGPGNKGRT